MTMAPYLKFLNVLGQTGIQKLNQDNFSKFCSVIFKSFFQMCVFHSFTITGGKFKAYYLSTLNILGTYTLCVTMLKIVYFVANLDKYLLQMADVPTG